jgi:hypothetical protein
VVDQRFWLGMLGQNGVLVNHPRMGRAMKPKQQPRKDLLNCGRAQIQASGFQPEVIDSRETSCDLFSLSGKTAILAAIA